MAISTMEQLTPRHFQIMDLVIQGCKSGEISKITGLSHPYVCLLMRAPNFQHQLAMRRERFSDKVDEKVINTVIEAGNVLKANALKAANKMVELVDSGTPGLQKSAAADILDRTGLMKQQQSTNTTSSKVVIIDEKSATIIENLLVEEKA